jgi:tRNA 2-thiouridine synthesizing protein C
MRSELLFVVSVDPAKRQVAIEVLSEILTFAAFDIPLRLLFLDQAIMLLMPGIDPEISGMMATLPLYGITDVFVEKESLIECGMTLDHVPEKFERLARSEISTFIQMHQRVMGV